MEKSVTMITPRNTVDSYNSIAYDYLEGRFYWNYDLKQDIQVLTDLYNKYKDEYIKLELYPAAETGTNPSFYIRGLRNFRKNEELEKAEKELEGWKTGFQSLKDQHQRYIDGIKAAEEKVAKLKELGV